MHKRAKTYQQRFSMCTSWQKVYISCSNKVFWCLPSCKYIGRLVVSRGTKVSDDGFQVEHRMTYIPCTGPEQEEHDEDMETNMIFDINKIYIFSLKSTSSSRIYTRLDDLRAEKKIVIFRFWLCLK